MACMTWEVTNQNGASTHENETLITLVHYGQANSYGDFL